MPAWAWVVVSVAAVALLANAPRIARLIGRTARAISPPRYDPPNTEPDPPEVVEARRRYREAKRQLREFKERERKARGRS